VNPSRQPYLNADVFSGPPGGYSGMYNIRPTMAGTAGEIGTQSFSGFSGYSAGNKTVPPGVLVSQITTDVNSVVNGLFNCFAMTPIAYELYMDMGPSYYCMDCVGSICTPECTAIKYFDQSWSSGPVNSTYYGQVSGFSGQVLQSVPINGEATINIETKDSYPRTPPGTGFFHITGSVNIVHSGFSSFYGPVENVSTEQRQFGYSNMHGEATYVTMRSPIQYAYIDETTREVLPMGLIGFKTSFSGQSGFSGYSGSSGFSASTGCSGI